VQISEGKNQPWAQRAGPLHVHTREKSHYRSGAGWSGHSYVCAPCQIAQPANRGRPTVGRGLSNSHPTTCAHRSAERPGQKGQQQLPRQCPQPNTRKVSLWLPQESKHSSVSNWPSCRIQGWRGAQNSQVVRRIGLQSLRSFNSCFRNTYYVWG
jgi:hypothetical protein